MGRPTGYMVDRVCTTSANLSQMQLERKFTLGKNCISDYWKLGLHPSALVCFSLSTSSRCRPKPVVVGPELGTGLINCTKYSCNSLAICIVVMQVRNVSRLIGN